MPQIIRTLPFAMDKNNTYSLFLDVRYAKIRPIYLPSVPFVFLKASFRDIEGNLETINIGEALHLLYICPLWL